MPLEKRARLPLFCFAAMVAAALWLLRVYGSGTNLSLFYLFRQDQWLLLGAAMLTGFCMWRLVPRESILKGSLRTALLAGALMAAAAFAGHYVVTSGYDLSRDEQMATFDAAVFAKGALVAPLPPLWRDHAEALNTSFMYPADQRGAWISAYLPLNAALRSIVGLGGTAALTGPLMIFIGALALWGCARRIWPQDREAATVATLLYAGSAQILFNGMAAYAMSTHLAFNLCWLWLFLARRPSTDLAALVLGFVAVGLHQPHMHPLFVGPILFLLLIEKNWRRAGFYFTGYAAVGVFWLWWPNAMWALSQANEFAPKPAGVDYLTRLLVELQKGDRMAFANMAANLLRFAAWQHLLLIPLLILGFRMGRSDRLAGALAAGLLATLAVMAVILPYQGHGFGYRYLHAVLGGGILLAVYGWTALGEAKLVWRPLLLRTTAAGLCLLLPLQAWMAHQFYTPYAQVSARIGASSADYVVIGDGDAPFSADLVINPPFLDQRPIRLLRGAIDPALIQALCSNRASVALVGNAALAPISRYFDFTPRASVTAANDMIAARLSQAGCRVALIR